MLATDISLLGAQSPLEKKQSVQMENTQMTTMQRC
jgi:hypothetical protein